MAEDRTLDHRKGVGHAKTASLRVQLVIRGKMDERDANVHDAHGETSRIINGGDARLAQSLQVAGEHRSRVVFEQRALDPPLRLAAVDRGERPAESALAQQAAMEAVQPL